MLATTTSLDLVPPPIFYYQHTFVLDRTLFAQALATTPHFFSGGPMVYEHLSEYFIPKDPSSKFLKLFQIVVIHRDILRSVALVLGVSRLLVMAKDTNGFHPIIVGKVFL
jgi:hypothetical protein